LGVVFRRRKMAAPKKRGKKKETSAEVARSRKESKSARGKKRDAGKQLEKKKVLKRAIAAAGRKKQVKSLRREVSKAKPPRVPRKRGVRAAPMPTKVEIPLAPAPPERLMPEMPAPRHVPVSEPKEIYIDRGLPLPQTYGEDRITAMAKDPNWIFAYWELTGPRKMEVEKQCGCETLENAAWVLRVHDCALSRWSDIRIDVSAGNWYIPVSEDRRFRVEIGVVTPDGRFIPFASSKELQTPRSGPSPEVSEKWLVSDETFKKFLTISYPVGASGLSPLEIAKRLREMQAQMRHPHK
jgi:hypothetical protein